MSILWYNGLMVKLIVLLLMILNNGGEMAKKVHKTGKASLRAKMKDRADYGIHPSYHDIKVTTVSDEDYKSAKAGRKLDRENLKSKKKKSKK